MRNGNPTNNGTASAQRRQRQLRLRQFQLLACAANCRAELLWCLDAENPNQRAYSTR
jgi:hypothetical protein